MINRKYVMVGIGLVVLLTLFWLVYPLFQTNDRPITCTSDEQCGGVVDQIFCQGNSQHTNRQTNTCISPGTPDAECRTEYETLLLEECEEGCANNVCI